MAQKDWCGWSQIVETILPVVVENIKDLKRTFRRIPTMSNPYDQCLICKQFLKTGRSFSICKLMFMIMLNIWQLTTIMQDMKSNRSQLYHFSESPRPS